MKTKSIYLDYAAATPLAPEVFKAMVPFLKDDFYNPSAGYVKARRVKKKISEARSRVAHWIGCKSKDVIFNAGVTESTNLAIIGIMRHHPGAKVLVGATEHEAVLEPAKLFNHDLIGVHDSGIVNLDDLQAKIDDEVALISLMYANNETGVIHPIKEVAELVNNVRDDRKSRGIDLPLLLHTDAAQAANFLDLHVSRLGFDLMSLNGAKIYGPKQSGILYIKAGIGIEPLIYGGGHERSLRGGTENVANIIGFAEALDRAQTSRKDETVRITKLRELLENKLLQRTDSKINGSIKHRIPSITNIMLGGGDGERLMHELDERGVMAATGAACSVADDQPSHVLTAMGLSEYEANSSLRISLGRPTTKEEIEHAAKQMIELVGD